MTFAVRASSSVQRCGVSAEMSIPSSAMAATTAGLSVAAGSEPRDSTRTRSAACSRMSAAAICERPALCTHRNSTVGRFVMPPSVSTAR
jgi:hypothetical protein